MVPLNIFATNSFRSISSLSTESLTSNGITPIYCFITNVKVFASEKEKLFLKVRKRLRAC
jgi:hypothetical protein